MLASTLLSLLVVSSAPGVVALGSTGAVAPAVSAAPQSVATVTSAGGSAPMSTGSVTITGRVSQIMSLRFNSHELHGAGVTGSNAGSGGSLDYTLDLGDVTQAAVNGVPMLGGSVTMVLRSNTPYTLAAQAQAIGFVPGERYVSLKDFGFAVPSRQIKPTGRLATNTGTRLASAVDSDLFTSPGVPFQTTLADVAGGMQFLGGETISHRGALNSAENGLLVTTQYGLRPQIFRSQNPFAVVVTYTLASP